MTQVKRSSISRRNKKNTNRELTILLGLGAVIILIIAATLALYNRSQENAGQLSATDQSRLIREDSPTRGPADAPVTLVEFLDPECEACRAAYPVVEQILEDYEGQIYYVVRYIPNHANSALAVAATEAAGEQGKYWEMQALLFATQPTWGEKQTAQTELFISYAQQLGLDTEQFKASLQNPAYTAKAQRDDQDAKALNVRGTPTFFVNGETVYGMDERAMRALIDEAIQ
jgi:protein-disulfide isomerase